TQSPPIELCHRAWSPMGSPRENTAPFPKRQAMSEEASKKGKVLVKLWETAGAAAALKDVENHAYLSDAQAYGRFAVACLVRIQDEAPTKTEPLVEPVNLLTQPWPG